MAVVMVTVAVDAMEDINRTKLTHKNSSLYTGNPRWQPRRKPRHPAKQMQLLTLMRHMAGTRTIWPCGIRRWHNSNNSKEGPQVASLPQEVHERCQMMRRDDDAHAAETRRLMLACMTNCRT
jgi:hypothetical protein